MAKDKSLYLRDERASRLENPLMLLKWARFRSGHHDVMELVDRSQPDEARLFLLDVLERDLYT